MSKEQIKTKKLRPIRAVIVKARQETPDTWTLYLFVSDQDKDYLAGQFVSIAPQQFAEIADLVKYLEYQKGKKEQVRAYSLTSAPYEKYLAITIKPESYEPLPHAMPPLLSPLLASNALVGREIEILGYTGAYILPENLDPAINHVVHLSAGSGIVPNFSILKDELYNHKNTHIKHTLIYVNKTFQDIIFHHELTLLLRKYPERLTIKYFLSQENFKAVDPSYIHGRPTVEQVKELVEDPKKALFFACGAAITKWQKKHAEEIGVPARPRFMEWVADVIQELEVDKKHFKREIYG
jgi:3-ketosteroid 9alpha-monooxygenase subunit B